MIYLCYRWILAIYFLCWQIFSLAKEGNNRYLIYETNWGFLIFNASLMISALSVTAKHISVHCISSMQEEDFSRKWELARTAPAGCCGYFDNKISWYHMLQWFCLLLGYEAAVVTMILYWCFVYDGESLSGLNINTHLINAIVAATDQWISGVPVNTLHVVYTMTYGAIYGIFTGLYYIGTKEAIYDVLDYSKNVWLSIGVIAFSIFVVGPFVHFIIFYFIYKVKSAVLYFLFGFSSEKN